MAGNTPKQEKIVTIYRERKLSGITKNDDFFQYVDLAQKKYFGKDQRVLIDYVKNLDLSALQKDNLLRNILIVSVANEEGYLAVDWERFFKQNTRELVKTTKLTMDYIKELYPSIIEKWDNAVAKMERENSQSLNR